MKKILIASVLFPGLLFLTGCSNSVNTTTAVKPFSDKKTQQIVHSIYNSLNDDERAAQLYGIRSSDLLGKDGKLSIDSCRKKIPFGIGHICQFACSLDFGKEELRAYVDSLQNYLLTETRAGIPAIFHEEAISGFAAKEATVYPQQIGVACTWNPELASQKTEQTAEAMRMMSSTLALSPMADVVRTPHFNRIEESYGEDGFLNARMTMAFIEGLQRKGLENGVAACTKHFLGYGGGSESPEKELMEEILLPHEVAMRKAGSKVVMTGYHAYNGTQTVANEYLIQDIIREYLEFDGLVVSDYGAVTYDCANATKDLLKNRAADALNAGNDIEFSHGSSYPFIPELIKEGKVDRKTFEAAVKRALTLKVRAGLFDAENRNKPEVGNLDKDEWRQTAYELACQSVVMLKNDGILPLKANNKKIALVGPNANTFWCMLGDYSYQSMQAFWFGGKIDGKNPDIVSLYSALKEKLPADVTLNYERGCDWSHSNEATIDKSGDPRTQRLKMMLMESADPTNYKRAMQLASSSDIVIAAVGENPTLCGEGRERKGIRLPGDQERFVEELLSYGKPVVLVVFGGRPQVLGDLADKCAAVFQAWYPGEEGGNAVADLLLGNVNPSGKLTVSYPATEAKGNYCYNYGLNDSNRIAYPFGFGLSYTTFEYSGVNNKVEAKTSDKSLSVSFELENTGDIDGDEIVQLYLSPLSGQEMKPIQLKGFQRVSLKSGDKKRITFEMPMDLFAIYKNKKWNILPGDYRCYIGKSSVDLPVSVDIKLQGSTVVKDIRQEYFPVCNVESL